MSEKDRTILKYDLSDERVQYLIRTDELLGKLIRYIGTSELVIERDGFKCLVKYITPLYNFLKNKITHKTLSHV